MTELDVDVDLCLKGKQVSRCCIDASFSLEILERGFRTEIRISTQMSIEQDGTRLELSAEKPMDAAKGAILQGKIVSNAVGNKDGSLSMTFTDGSKLTVPVSDNYEAWTLNASDGFLVVSQPGGKLAVWSPIKSKIE